MNHNFEDVLDVALEQLEQEPITAVLNQHPEHAEMLAPLLATAETLADWQSAVPTEPNPEWQMADRAVFQSQIEQLPAPAVSPAPLLRLNRWLKQKFSARRNRQTQKERYAMNAIFARAVAAAVVIFGIGGGTVALASDSLPDSALYPVKLMVEDTQLALADSPLEQADLHMALAQVRLEEMQQLMVANKGADDQFTARLETHLEQALQYAAQTDDTNMVGLLTQMQTMLQAGQRTMQQTQTQLSEPAQNMFGAVNQVMNQYQEQVQVGLEDPQLFRWRHGQNPDWEPPCPQGGCDPAGSSYQHGQNQETNGQNGPGDGTCIGDCEPVGDQNQYGQDENNGQNGAGNGDNSPGSPNDNGQNGPGDGTCIGDCDPVGDQNQYGQDGTNSGQNGLGDGDGVCVNNCEPTGSGPQPDHGNGHGNGG